MTENTADPRIVQNLWLEQVSRSRLGRPIKTCPKCFGPRFMPSLVSEQDWTCMDCDYSTYDDDPLDAETFDFLAKVGALR